MTIDEPVEINHYVQHRYPDEINFCVLCAGVMAWRLVLPDRRRHRVCTRCGYVAFLSPKLAAACLVEQNARVLLLRRGIEPQMGRWTLPGGYVDLGENPAQAAVRETLEEVGLKVRVKNLLGLYWSDPQPPTIVAVYLAAPSNQAPTTSEEAAEVAYFSPELIPWKEIAFSTTRDALRDWTAAHQAAGAGF
jgi:ADP-ribose pyrophosphatase YjhB (NUDIX family)